MDALSTTAPAPQAPSAAELGVAERSRAEFRRSCETASAWLRAAVEQDRAGLLPLVPGEGSVPGPSLEQSLHRAAAICATGPVSRFVASLRGGASSEELVAALLWCPDLGFDDLELLTASQACALPSALRRALASPALAPVHRAQLAAVTGRLLESCALDGRDPSPDLLARADVLSSSWQTSAALRAVSFRAPFPLLLEVCERCDSPASTEVFHAMLDDLESSAGEGSRPWDLLRSALRLTSVL